MFGEAAYDILPNLTATAGGRAYIYDNSLIGFFGFGRNPNGPPYNGAGSSRTGVAGCYTTTGQLLRDNPGGTLFPGIVDGTYCTNLATFAGGGLVPKKTEGQGATYRFNLTWKPADGILLYGTWSRGFRPGGINRRADVQPYAADFLTNYELGAKTTLLGGKLRLNGAIYQQQWDKFQFSFLGANSFTEIHNGPNARIRGAEADANLSLGGLTLTAAGSYTDAKTRQNLCKADDPTFTCGGDPLQIAAPAGTRLPITPKVKLNGTVRYAVPVGDFRAYLQGLVAYQSSASTEIRVDYAAALGRLKAFTTGNISIGAEFPRYTLELFVQNVGDTRAQLSRYQACGSCTDRNYTVVSTPRTIGIRAGAKF
jgi:outer membrane receptor protein involved in Fe transport